MQIAYNNSTVDFISSVAQSIDGLIASGSPVFLTAGHDLVNGLGIIMLSILGVKWAAAASSGHHHHFDLPGALHFLLLFGVTEGLLKYYNVGLPWTFSSVKTLIPDTATQFSAAIDISTLNAFNSSISGVLNNLQRPGLLDLFNTWVYFLVLGIAWILQGLMFGVNVLGMIGVGIGGLLGPLFLPWLMVPRMSWLAWNWFSFMLTYSFYRVVASALTFIWTTVFTSFIANTVKGDYTLDHFLILLPALALLCAGMLFSVFRIGAFTTDLFRGGASAGASIGNSVQGAIQKGIATL